MVFTEAGTAPGAGEFVIIRATSTEEIGNPPHHGTVASYEVGIPSSHIAHVGASRGYGDCDVYMDTETRDLRRILATTPTARLRAC
ncbi:MAG: hypothetical protein ACLU0O_04110 [Collinsella sp.]